MKTQLYIGQPRLRGAITKYAARYNLIELRAEFGRLPRSALLRRWTEEVPRDFVFSVMLSRQVGSFGKNFQADLDLGLQIAEAVTAKWLVVQTDPTIGPSQRSRRRLQDLFGRLTDSGRRIGWDPHGVWQEEELASWTRELGVYLVRDISRGEVLAEDIIYSRLPGIGTSSRMSSGALEKAANSLLHSSEAYVVVGGDRASKVLQLLRSLVVEGSGPDNIQSKISDVPEEFVDLLDESDDDRATRDDDEFIDDDDSEDDADLSSDDDAYEEDGRRETRTTPKKRPGVNRR
jgi:uncharacterized protein YecE (DUF72 family)